MLSCSHVRNLTGVIVLNSSLEVEAIEHLLALASPRPDWRMLDLAQGEMSIAPPFSSHVRQIAVLAREMAIASDPDGSVCADAHRMPFAANSFDVVILHGSVYPRVDMVIDQVGDVLKSRGLFMILTDLMPENAHAARYIQAFERLCDPRKDKLFAEYEWRGMCLNAGMIVDSVEITCRRTMLIPWAKRYGCDEVAIERLQIMLAQAPDAVQAFWQPGCVGTLDAAFDQYRLLLMCRKP